MSCGRTYQINIRTMRAKMTSSLSEAYLRRLLEEPRQQLFELEALVCHFTGITHEQLCSVSKKWNLSDARAVFFRLAREAYPAASLALIGNCVNRDHSTVIAGINRTKDVRETNQLYWKIANQLKKHYQEYADYSI